MKYHFGCGTDILPGYINCDSYEWPGVDQVIDLTEPYLEYGVTEVFSNAFFEHLYIRERHVHLESVLGALAPNGVICYLGIPWFPGVAKAYIDGSPGTIKGERFDIYHVWRYTHGAPESAGYDYLSQLHKGLFDEEEFKDLFDRVGTSSLLFTYIYPGEPEEVRVTAGMYLTEGNADRDALVLDASNYLRKWDGKFLEYESVRFIDF